MIYSLSGLSIFTVGLNLRQIPRRYLLAGSVLFVSAARSASPCRWVRCPPAGHRGGMVTQAQPDHFVRHSLTVRK